MRALLLLLAALAAPPAMAAEEALPRLNWSFAGPFGSFDLASAQRGWQVYSQVCSACHSLKQASYRDLTGIGLTGAQVAAIASQFQVPSLTDDGQPTDRPATPADRFRSPFPNDLAARAANNGALPPDLSVIEKAREGGANYLHALMIGYEDPPAGFTVGQGLYYNRFFPGQQIAMPQPLHDGQVEYADGTTATVDQMARDVTTFLAFIANPEMETRKRNGVRFVLFLIVLTGLTYAVKRQIWSDVH